MDINNSSNNSNDNQFRHSVDSSNSKPEIDIIRRQKSSRYSRWRSHSLANIVKLKNPMLQSLPSKECHDNVSQETLTSSTTTTTSIALKTDKKNIRGNNKESKKGEWSTIVTVALVEGKGLPDPPNDGSVHGLYCKIRLGTELFKSKCVPNTQHPEWRERFQLHLYKDHLLNISLWDRGRHKNFMGSCTLDLSSLEKERTHEIWQPLEDGFGMVHLSVTMCTIRNKTNPFEKTLNDEARAKYAWYNVKTDWKSVGQLQVKVLGARGLSGKPLAYCTVEVDNERVQTHCARPSSEPMWDKSYMFNVYDVTSCLVLKVYDGSLVTAFRFESLGKISIPLLRIRNGEIRWYALKDRNKRNGARGNCPRVRLQMSMIWNPLKASLRLFRPKEVKHIRRKTPKFDIAMVYNNLEFVRDTFNILIEINENIKYLFEWENHDLSFIGLVCWLVLWYYVQMWMTPLLLLLPFFYHWVYHRNQYEHVKTFRRVYSDIDDMTGQTDDYKEEKSLTSRIQGLQEMTLTITSGVEYMSSLAERVYNLACFKVPFLSYLSMIFLIITSVVLYLIPMNYILMAFGVYKYTRKYLNPERTLNNDLLDFLSRVPDNEMLKDWKELSVPEPN